MSRHRNVRSTNFYSEECEGFDDVYGHSVEDDYCVSPSVAEQFLYDRNRRQQMSVFLGQEEEIAEEDEGEEGDEEAQPGMGDAPKSAILSSTQGLSDIDQARLQSCLEEVRNVVGDSIAEQTVIEAVLRCEFNVEKALNMVLNNATGVSETGASKIQKTDLRKEKAPKKQVAGLIEDEEGGGADIADGGLHHSKADVATVPAAVVVVPAVVKTITKGFEIRESKETSKPNSRELSPRSQSPVVTGDKRIPDEGATDERIGTGEDSVTLERDNATPLKNRNTVDAVSQYAKERGGEGKKELLHMVVVGHVDAGKSTLMGHLLYALGQVNKRVMHKYEQESKKLGKQSFVYAWILDETGEERSRGITMDVGQNRFDTPTKAVVLLDAPGHRDFIPNMISGASRADVALLVVDATRGEFETGFESGGQTREHALLVRSLGVNQLAVAVNKMDNVGWSQERFLEVVTKLGTFLKQAGFREGDITFVPCSGLVGQNLAVPPTEEALIKWYSGPCLLDVIDNFKTPPRPITRPFRMSVNDIFKGTGSGFCVAGRVEAGTLQLGDRVLVQPQGELAQVKGISIDELPAQVTFAGDQPCVTLSGIDMQNVMVGYILSDPANALPVTSKITARIVVFNIKVPITRGFPVVFHHQSLMEHAVITKLIAQLNKSTGEVAKKHPRCLTKNSNATVEIETARPVCVELYRDVKELGRFMLRSQGLTIAAGLVTQIH
ncbi:protein HBS1 isoform X1 [Ischnura elegans]|uniref:protein HBS1 isoform X1 n=1 Tax=Ischnura elegans TaxID=197161 RepID=UPI001ED87801|nr:protein HBS1 isoform X1 [Ischnura elegans]